MNQGITPTTRTGDATDSPGFHLDDFDTAIPDCAAKTRILNADQVKPRTSMSIVDVNQAGVIAKSFHQSGVGCCLFLRAGAE